MPRSNRISVTGSQEDADQIGRWPPGSTQNAASASIGSSSGSLGQTVSLGAGGLVWAYASDGSEGVEFRAPFMRPFAPCFGRSAASAQVYPMRRRERAVMTGLSIGGEQFVKQADKQLSVCH
jgi:hypothetical protein